MTANSEVRQCSKSQNLATYIHTLINIIVINPPTTVDLLEIEPFDLGAPVTILNASHVSSSTVSSSNTRKSNQSINTIADSLASSSSSAFSPTSMLSHSIVSTPHQPVSNETPIPHNSSQVKLDSHKLNIAATIASTTEKANTSSSQKISSNFAEVTPIEFPRWIFENEGSTKQHNQHLQLAQPVRPSSSRTSRRSESSDTSREGKRSSSGSQQSSQSLFNEMEDNLTKAVNIESIGSRKRSSTTTASNASITPPPLPPRILFLDTDSRELPKLLPSQSSNQVASKRRLTLNSAEASVITERESQHPSPLVIGTSIDDDDNKAANVTSKRRSNRKEPIDKSKADKRESGSDRQVNMWNCNSYSLEFSTLFRLRAYECLATCREAKRLRRSMHLSNRKTR
jgi:uncharacterized OsmC-like protein